VTVEINRVAGLPVIVCKVVGAVTPPDDQTLLIREVVELKRQFKGPVYRIIDLTVAQMTFQDMVASIRTEHGRDGGSEDRDVTTIFVATSDLVRIGVAGLRNQPQYGTLNVYLVASPDQAFDLVRQLEAERQKARGH